ncbi:MAG: sulfotransferase, partial [Pseudomonadota bacterium]
MFFIVGCGRSGTTAVAKLLDLDSKLDIQIEPLPYMAPENRAVSQGRQVDLSLAVDAFFSGIPCRIARKNDPLYGEKHVTLGPFLNAINAACDAKFVFLHRDGRDVVRSWMDWHTLGFGSIYREAPIDPKLSDVARRTALNLPLDNDLNEISRHRDCTNAIDVFDWLNHDRFDMVTSMWSEVNRVHREQLASLPNDRVLTINMSHFGLKQAQELFSFLDRPCPSEKTMDPIIAGNINSTAERGFGDAVFPSWPDWDQIHRKRFTKLAGKEMTALGHWSAPENRWLPPGMAKFWKEKEDVADWYAWMYDHRKSMHNAFFDFVESVRDRGDVIGSVIDLGCGVGHGYSERFADIDYIGYDLSTNAIAEGARQASDAGRDHHRFIERDYLREGLLDGADQADIVFSSGTIDNVYDVERCVELMVKCARKFVYLTAYRG